MWLDHSKRHILHSEQWQSKMAFFFLLLLLWPKPNSCNLEFQIPLSNFIWSVKCSHFIALVFLQKTNQAINDLNCCKVGHFVVKSQFESQTILFSNRIVQLAACDKNVGGWSLLDPNIYTQTISKWTTTTTKEEVRWRLVNVLISKVDCQIFAIAHRMHTHRAADVAFISLQPEGALKIHRP